MGPVMRAQEMAQELLQRREAERNAKSWENAPEWANWYSETYEGTGFYTEREPVAGKFAWHYIYAGDIEQYKNADWQSTLQKRPK